MSISQPTSGIRSPWLARLAIAFASPLLGLLLLEGALRIADYGFPTTFLVPLKADGRPPLLVDNQYFGYRFFPPRMARTAQPIAVSPAKERGAIRILVLGESAAMGDPLPEFGLARHLGALLQRRFPSRRIETVNAAMTAINSHVIREIADEIVRLQPDAVVIYAGNNEVLGPYGPGTVLAPFARAPGYARLSVLAGRLRAAQLMRSLLQRVRPAALTEAEWSGLSLFQDRAVRADDPRLAVTYRAFDENLDAIVRAARGTRARTILCTVAVNLRDFAPFRSEHGARITPEAQARVAAALRAEGQTGERADAMALLRDALALDEDYAETHFRLGRLLLAEGRTGEALAAFERARDLDALRFRTDSRINDIIRGVAARHPDVELLDTAKLASEASEDGVPGDDLFIDHVHFTFHGTYLLATAVGDALLSLFDAPSPSAWIDEPACRKDLALGPWDEARAAEIMMGRFQAPPFAGRTGVSNAIAALSGTRDAMRAQSAAVADADLPAAYRIVGPAEVDDPTLRTLLAFRYAERSQYTRAEAEFARVLQAWPHRFDTRAALAQVIARQGRHAAALAVLEDPSMRKGAFHVAVCLDTAAKLLEVGDAAGARIFLREALRSMPRSPEIRMRLAELAEADGRLDEAEAGYRWLVKHQPSAARPHARLGAVLALQGRWQEATSALQAAMDLDPDNPSHRYDFAVVLLDQGRDDEAEAALLHLVKTGRADTFVHHQLGVIASRRARWMEAAAHFERAVELQPGAAESLHGGGLAYAALGRYAEASRFLDLAASIDTNNVQYLNDRAWLLATCPDAAVRDPATALDAARRANDLTGGRSAAILDTLAAAHASGGAFAEARDAAGRALAAAPSAPLSAAIRQRLALYDRGRAYIDKPAQDPPQP